MKERCECVYELAAVKRAHILAAIKQNKKERQTDQKKREKKPFVARLYCPIKTGSSAFLRDSY